MAWLDGLWGHRYTWLDFLIRVWYVIFMERKVKVDWEAVDWRKQNAELVAELGVSKQRVNQMRPLGSKPDGYRRHIGSVVEDSIAVMATVEMTAEQVGKAVGCSEAYAGVVMRKLGKSYMRKSKWNSKYDWSLFPRGWKSMTDKEIAVLVGASVPAIVTQWRIRHGMRK